MRELIAGGLLFVGGWCLVSGLRAVMLGFLSRRWPEADGVIRKAKVVRSRNSEGDEMARQELEYTYSVGGRRYRGTRVRFGLPRRLSSTNQPSPLFRRGERVAVFHSSSRPAVSVLTRGVSPFVLIPLISGGAVVLAGIRLL